MTIDPTIEELEDVFLPDCADGALSEHPVMAKRCADCAGREGSDASRHPITSQTLADCKRRRFPFWCHLTQDGEFCAHLCADWAEAVRP